MITVPLKKTTATVLEAVLSLPRSDAADAVLERLWLDDEGLRIEIEGGKQFTYLTQLNDVLEDLMRPIYGVAVTQAFLCELHHARSAANSEACVTALEQIVQFDEYEDGPFAIAWAITQLMHEIAWLNGWRAAETDLEESSWAAYLYSTNDSARRLGAVTKRLHRQLESKEVDLHIYTLKGIEAMHRRAVQLKQCFTESFADSRCSLSGIEILIDSAAALMAFHNVKFPATCMS